MAFSSNVPLEISGDKINFRNLSLLLSFIFCLKTKKITHCGAETVEIAWYPVVAFESETTALTVLLTDDAARGREEFVLVME